MQVLACMVLRRRATFKPHFADITTHDLHGPRGPFPARRGRAPAMMAPVIILGAIMMFVFWDTADRG
jgi:hypothetical protein